jgi:lipopolysaccharide transport system permease protein
MLSLEDRGRSQASTEAATAVREAPPAIASAPSRPEAPVPGPEAPGPVLVIEAGRMEGQYWKDLWAYRELFLFLAWRDILVRYKQTVVGVAWSVLRPAATMAAFTLVFGGLAHLPSRGGAPYPILVGAAILPWQFFAGCVQESSTSIVNNAGMISKIYFPRLVIPASSVLVNFVDLLISFAVLLVAMAVYGFSPGLSILALPGFLLLAAGAALGAGLWLSALTVKYRDFRHVVPFLIQFGLYLSPVGYSAAVVPERWRTLYSMNPMVGVIEGFRWSILGTGEGIDATGLAISVALVVLLLASGLRYFRATERSFADVI